MPSQPVDKDSRGRAALGAERMVGWALPMFAMVAVASISLQNIIYVAVAAWLLGMGLRKKWSLVKTPMNWPLICLAAILFASSLWAGRLNPSIFGLKKIGIMSIFFLTAASIRHPVKSGRIIDFFIIGAIVCALWSICVHLAGRDGGRVTSFSGDYMAAGGMYMLGFILATARLLHSRDRAKWLWLTGAAILGLALLFTYTRSSWIGAMAGLLLLGIFRDWRLPAALLAAGLVFLIVWPQNPITQRVFSLTSKYHCSNAERRYMWKTGLQLLRDQPMRGYGVDNLSEDYGRYANPEAREQRPPHVHNTLLQMAINGGLLATGVYLWWAITVIVFGFRAWRHCRDLSPERAGAVLGLTAAFVGFFINGMFEFNFGTSQVIAIIYFLTGLLPAYAYNDPQGPAWKLPERPRLLFLRPRFRGDVLLASSLPRLVKRDYSQAKVDLLTEPASVGSARGEPAWSNVISLPRHNLAAWWKTVRYLRTQDYDAVCDLFGNPRTAWLAFFSGARFKIGPQVTGWDIFYHMRTRPDRPGPRPAQESFFDILRCFGMKKLSLRPRWVMAEEDHYWIKGFFRERGVSSGKILGLFPGGSHPAKRWPLKNFLEIASRAPRELGLKAMFVFGPREKDIKMEYMHAAAKLSLSVEGLPPARLAALWSHCAVILSNDAFPMHVGPAVGTPTIGLFGPGDPAVWFPYSERTGHRAIHQAPECWPCHKDICENTICWDNLTPDMVMVTIKEVLMKKQRVSTKKSEA